jgi:hypothetical protein
MTLPKTRTMLVAAPRLPSGGSYLVLAAVLFLLEEIFKQTLTLRRAEDRFKIGGWIDSSERRSGN